MKIHLRKLMNGVNEWNISYFLDASANPKPTRPPRTNAAPPATATPAIVSLSIFFRMCSCSEKK